MKGIIFREFIDYAEDAFGLEVVDKILSAGNLPSGGAYTSVGTYDSAELAQMLSHLAELKGVPSVKLLRGFGEHLFRRLAQAYSNMVDRADSAFGLLKNVDSYIHVEVRKLYPDAELPVFTHELEGPDRMKLVYRSARALADLAEGLIRGCAAHFGENIELVRKDLGDGSGRHVCFSLKRRQPDG